MYKTQEYSEAELAEYGISLEVFRAIRGWMSNNWEYFNNSTVLAEEAVYLFGEDEWLDCETHPIWELALEYMEEE